MTRIIRTVGDSIAVRGELGTIMRVWPAGTVDVRLMGGAYVRVTGLPIFASDDWTGSGPAMCGICGELRTVCGCATDTTGETE